MQLGMVGLGRMGANMVRRLLKNGHSCVVFDRSPEAVEQPGQGEGDRSRLAGRPGKEARETAGSLADGSSGSCGRDHC